MTIEELAAKKAAEAAQQVQQPTQGGADPQEAAAQEVQESKPATGETEEQADSILNIFQFMCFTIDYLKDPEEAILTYNIPGAERIYPEISKSQFNRLVKKAAAATGASPEEIADKDRRTPEQQKALVEAAAQEPLARLDAFMNSNYAQALETLDTVQGEYPDPEPENDYTLKQMAALYFFAIHWKGVKADKIIMPTAERSLTEENIDEIKTIFSRLDAYYMEKTKGGKLDRKPRLFLDFLKNDKNYSAITEELEIKAITEAIPLLQSITPNRHTMPTHALMNALQEGVKHTDGRPPAPPINAGEFALTVANPKGRRKEITAYTMIEYNSGETGVTITPTKLSEYERQVSDAIISLWEQAKADKLNPIFTTDMIYRAMPGGGDKASPQQRGAITKAIEKFRKLHIVVDATEEMQRRGKIKPNETVTFDDFYLSARHAEYKAKNGGQIVSAYKINTEPIILSYARMTNQILTVPAQFIEIQKVKKGRASGELVAMTPDRQAITGYLLRQIAWIKYDRNRKATNPRSDVIKFDTIFADVGIDTSSRTNANRQRDFVYSVLDYEAAAGYITGYERLTKGRSIYGVKIIP